MHVGVMVDPLSPSEPSRPKLCLLVLFSLLFGLGVIAFRAGLDATPYETADPQGRTMGFNDSFYAEHYGIILSNCSAYRTLNYLSPYDYLFIAAHLVMAVLLLRGVGRGWVIGFGAIQPLVFPFGVPGVLFLVVKIASVFSNSNDDREAFIDIPFIALMAHPVWLIACAVIVWKFWRARRRELLRARALGANGGELLA
jgi:ribose/xylose/arabinose/galactoside ABC-type transport system permease subunit